jgi:hypothetical protein
VDTLKRNPLLSSISVTYGLNKYQFKTLPDWRSVRYLSEKYGSVLELNYQYNFRESFSVYTGFGIAVYQFHLDSVLWDINDPLLKPKGYQESAISFVRIPVGLSGKVSVHKKFNLIVNVDLGFGRIFHEKHVGHYYDPTIPVNVYSDWDFHEWAAHFSMRVGVQYKFNRILLINLTTGYLETYKVFGGPYNMSDVRHIGANLGLSISF